MIPEVEAYVGDPTLSISYSPKVHSIKTKTENPQNISFLGISASGLLRMYVCLSPEDSSMPEN